jgi:hypothetical protein
MIVLPLFIYCFGLLLSAFGSFIMWSAEPMYSAITFSWFLDIMGSSPVSNDYWQNIRAGLVILFLISAFVSFFIIEESN